MDAFISRKRRRLSPSPPPPPPAPTNTTEEESTDLKLALLVSLFPNMAQETLLDILTASDGSVETATSTLSQPQSSKTPRTHPTMQTPKIQTSLSSHITPSTSNPNPNPKPLTRKGRTLHLYSPIDIATHTPCTLIPNFLAPDLAHSLLTELLEESVHFKSQKFQLFNRTVQSPHSHTIYVSSPESHIAQTTAYKYGGTYRSDVRQITPHMRIASARVQERVNEEIRHRIRSIYPDGKKLRFQSPREWVPNAAFVNCYNGPTESVGWHSDELTYLGPRAVIGSLSLGVEREFRVRRVVPTTINQDDEDDEAGVGVGSGPGPAVGDTQGQISIHLPHNSLLVMHAEMQEEWKHSISPAQSIEPHPVSGNRRINITYRWYRESLHPRYTPRCHCGSHAILRCVQRKRETRGKYMWMCYSGYAPGGESCSFFQWAEFDDDGEPIWDDKKESEDAAPTLQDFVEGR